MKELQVDFVPQEFGWRGVRIKFTVNERTYTYAVDSIFTPKTPEKLKEWAIELRTTRFGQARNLLVDSEQKFCCLGILGQRLENINEYPNATMLTSVDFSNLLCITENNDRFQEIFSFLNDDINLTFHEIAEFIEELVESIEKKLYKTITRQEKELK